MNILMPIHNPETVEAMASCSADIEFYAGFEDAAWYERFGQNEDLNRMSAFRTQANMSTGLIERIANAANKGKKSLFVTLNAGIYSIAQERWLQGTLRTFRDVGVTGIIVGDPCLVQTAKAYDLKIVASTMVGIYNEDLAKWAADIGFDRVILPRDMTLSEMKSICKSVPELEYECFLMRNGCRYSDSHCLCRHSDRCGALCTYLDGAHTNVHCGQPDFSKREEAYYNHYVFSKAFHKDACGACAIWRMLQMGITAGKVVGRADSSSAVLDDVDMLVRNINIAAACSSEEEYLEKMVFPARSKDICIKGVCCYYPEIRYKEV